MISETNNNIRHICEFKIPNYDDPRARGKARVKQRKVEAALRQMHHDQAIIQIAYKGRISISPERLRQHVGSFYNAWRQFETNTAT